MARTVERNLTLVNRDSPSHGWNPAAFETSSLSKEMNQVAATAKSRSQQSDARRRKSHQRAAK
jgi:hypothetical protein